MKHLADAEYWVLLCISKLWLKLYVLLPAEKG